MERLLLKGNGGRLLDIGANTGEYTSIARKYYDVIAIDNDHDCADSIKPLSLWADICNPSPAIGWVGKERQGLLDRLRAYNRDGTVLVLALLHHLCIGNNIPISMVLDLLETLGREVIVEFIPPDDPMAEKIGYGRVYPEYNLRIFEKELRDRFDICEIIPIKESGRILYQAVRKR